MDRMTYTIERAKLRTLQARLEEVRGTEDTWTFDYYCAQIAASKRKCQEILNRVYAA